MRRIEIRTEKISQSNNDGTCSKTFKEIKSDVIILNEKELIN